MPPRRVRPFWLYPLMSFPSRDTTRAAAIPVLSPFNKFAAKFGIDPRAAVIRQKQYVRPTDVFVDPGEALQVIRGPTSVFVRVGGMTAVVRVCIGGVPAAV